MPPSEPRRDRRQEAEPLSDLMGAPTIGEMIRVWVRRLLAALRDGTR